MTRYACRLYGVRWRGSSTHLNMSVLITTVVSVDSAINSKMIGVNGGDD